MKLFAYLTPTGAVVLKRNLDNNQYRELIGMVEMPVMNARGMEMTNDAVESVMDSAARKMTALRLDAE